jgi:hypothetical protein
MRQIKPLKQRGPMMLMDKVFNIPIFNAATQQYVCTEVADLGSDATSKKYGVYFRWITSTYAVPEVLKIDITIGLTGSNHIEVQLYEKYKSGKYVLQYNKGYDKERISSVTKMQSMLNDLIKD